MSNIRITLHTKLKHATLFEAACRLGSQSELARRLGVLPTVIGRWINLQEVPKGAFGEGKNPWEPERVESFEKAVFEETGKTLEDLWPKELRNAKEFLKAGKTLNIVKEISVQRLTSSIAGRLALPDTTKEVDTKDRQEVCGSRIETILRTLTWREREVVKLRYGLGDGLSYTYEEVARIFKVTRERVRQLEAHAMRKMQAPHLRNQLASLLD